MTKLGRGFHPEPSHADDKARLGDGLGDASLDPADSELGFWDPDTQARLAGRLRPLEGEGDAFLGPRRQLQTTTEEPVGDLPPIDFGSPATQEYHYKHNDPYYDLKNPIMGIIIGSMFGGAVFLCIMCWICRWCRRCRHRRKKKKMRKKQEKARLKREAEKRMNAIREMEDDMMKQAQGDARFAKGKKDKKKKGIKLG